MEDSGVWSRKLREPKAAIGGLSDLHHSTPLVPRASIHDV